MKLETFKQAHTRIASALVAGGWTPSPRLKVPYVTSPDGTVRIWFKGQALYHSHARYRGQGHSLGEARSLCSDPRGADVEWIAQIAFMP